MFDYNQLNCFIAVAEELHFGRAAARLFMTQPPLSRQIQLLEHALGVTLFERTSRSVHLTPAGQIFLGDAKRIVDLSQQAKASALRAAKGKTGRVTLGFTASAGYELVPSLLVQAQKSLPHVDFVMHEQVSTNQIEALKANMIDVGFMRPIFNRLPLEFLLVEREPLVVALPVGHRLLVKEALTLRDLHKVPLVTYSPREGTYLYDLIVGLLHSYGSQPNFVQYAEQNHTLLALVRAGLGIAIVPASTKTFHFDNVEFRDIDHSNAVAEIFMAWRAENTNPALENFRNFSKVYFDKTSTRKAR